MSKSEAPPIPKPTNPIKPYKQPDASKYNPDPDYIRWLVKQKGISMAEACRRLGIPQRTMSDKLNPKMKTQITYCEQYALENI